MQSFYVNQDQLHKRGTGVARTLLQASDDVSLTIWQSVSVILTTNWSKREPAHIHVPRSSASISFGSSSFERSRNDTLFWTEAGWVLHSNLCYSCYSLWMQSFYVNQDQLHKRGTGVARTLLQASDDVSLTIWQSVSVILTTNWSKREPAHIHVPRSSASISFGSSSFERSRNDTLFWTEAGWVLHHSSSWKGFSKIFTFSSPL